MNCRARRKKKKWERNFFWRMFGWEGEREKKCEAYQKVFFPKWEEN